MNFSQANASFSVAANAATVQASDNGYHLIGGKHFVAKYPWTALPYLTIATVASGVGILGNLGVLIVIFAHKPLKNARNAFLVNLALADLLVTAIADPFGVIGKIFLLCQLLDRAAL